MNSLDKQYQELLRTILTHGVVKEDRTGTGTKSIFGYTIRHNMAEGFPLLTTKKMAWKTMVTELLWFLRGDTNIKYLVDNDCHIWDGDAYKNYVTSDEVRWPKSKEDFIKHIKNDREWEKKWGELGPIYGKQWRGWNKYIVKPGLVSLGDGRYNENYWDIDKPIDQIANLINDLKTNPDSRRLMVTAWNPGELDQMVLPPCHYGFQVYTRDLTLAERIKAARVRYPKFNTMDFGHADGISEEEFQHHQIDEKYPGVPTRAISLMYNARSQDVPLGTPFNLASYGLLLTIIAKEVGMVPDELISNMGDCHIYLNQIDGVKEQLTRKPYSLPQLSGKDEYHYLMDLDIPFSEKIEQFKPDFWKLENYQSHPSIKMPLSN